MKRNFQIVPFILTLCLFYVIYNLDHVTDYVTKLISPIPKVIIDPPNEYSKNMDYGFVKKTNDFIPYSKQDIMNLFYSFLDNGYDNFTFYCPSEYSECVSDMTNLINDQTLITEIGNYVHPFNNFRHVYLTTTSTGEINLRMDKTYSDEKIAEINRLVDNIFTNIFNDNMDIKDKILAAHDYIIDNTSYDESANEDINAYDLFTRGKSKCFGYADAMAIILNRLNVVNYKIGSSEHVWNALYIDNTWYHVDVTWDDPVIVGDGNITSTIRHKFYMIDTDTLLSYDTDEHNFNKSVYLEFKK